MTLSRALIPSQKGWNRCPPVAMDLEDHGAVVLGFQTNERGRFEVLNGISECGPNLIMRFKMKAKIWTEAAWDGGLEVCIRSNSICAPLQERPKMMQAGTRRDGENLIAMESPGEAEAHIHQWQETTIPSRQEMPLPRAKHSCRPEWQTLLDSSRRWKTKWQGEAGER
jgi:hypothetical protein